MLKIGAEAFGYETSPEHVLVHGGGVLAPLREVL
jgi:hypothetical protein